MDKDPIYFGSKYVEFCAIVGRLAAAQPPARPDGHHRLVGDVRGGPDPPPPAARRRGPRQRDRDRQLPGRGDAGPADRRGGRADPDHGPVARPERRRLRPRRLLRPRRPQRPGLVVRADRRRDRARLPRPRRAREPRRPGPGAPAARAATPSRSPSGWPPTRSDRPRPVHEAACPTRRGWRPARRRTGRSPRRPRRGSGFSASTSRRTRALPTIRPSATGASVADLLGRADPEADADRQVGLGPEPGDVLGQLGREARPLAGDPGDRDVVDEPGRRPGDLDGAVAGGRRRDELDQPEVERGRLAGRAPPTPRRAGRGRSGRRSRRRPPRGGSGPPPGDG